MFSKKWKRLRIIIFCRTKHTQSPNYVIRNATHQSLLTSRGRLRKIQPDSGWMSKYLRSSLWKGAARLYLMAPLLSASSSEAETLKMFVPMFVSCFTFSMYFWTNMIK